MFDILSCYITKDFILITSISACTWNETGSQQEPKSRCNMLLSIYSSSMAGSHLLDQLKLPDVLGVSPTSHTLQHQEFYLLLAFVACSCQGHYLGLSVKNSQYNSMCLLGNALSIKRTCFEFEVSYCMLVLFYEIAH